MEEEDLENIIFFRIFARHVTCPKKERKGVIPHHHTIMKTRWVEVILVGGE